MKRLPPLPRTVDAPGGRVTVEQVDAPLMDGATECWGLYDSAHRCISIDRSLPLRKRWNVLYHELTHVAILDAGLDNGIEDRLHEAICDAMATARMRERFG